MSDYTQSVVKTTTFSLRQSYAPVLISGALTIWTAMVYPFSEYGDSWAIWPALASLPIVVLWHSALVFKFRGNRRLTIKVALIHLVLFIPGWFGCLMLICKDSL